MGRGPLNADGRRAEVVAPLYDLAMVTYTVPPERVQQHLLPGCELEARTDAQGRPWAFVSAVMFENRRTGPTAIPWLRLTFPQVNYRTYVRCRGISGAWFFAVVLRSRMADVQRMICRAPSYRAALALTPGWDAEHRRYRRYRFESATRGFKAQVEMESVGGTPAPGECFTSSAEMNTWLTMRLEGFYRQIGTLHTAQMSVWHEPMQPHAGAVRSAYFELFDRLGLVTAEEQARPYAVLLQPQIDFFGINPRRIA